MRREPRGTKGSHEKRQSSRRRNQNMNNAIAAMLFLVVLLLGTSKHQKVRSVLAGINITTMRRPAIRTNVLILCSALIPGVVPTSRYGNSTSVPVEHKFEGQPQTRNETGVSETNSRYGNSPGAWVLGGAERRGRWGMGWEARPSEDYHDSPHSKKSRLVLIPHIKPSS